MVLLKFFYNFSPNNLKPWLTLSRAKFSFVFNELRTRFCVSRFSMSVWTQALCFYLKRRRYPIKKSCTGEAPEPSRTLGSNKTFNLLHVPKYAKFSSCVYCGRIHGERCICKKRQQIKKRDSYLCQICIREMYDTYRKYNCNDLQVHHAVPINASKELRLDNNLITLCSMHHAMCDIREFLLDEKIRMCT